MTDPTGRHQRQTRVDIDLGALRSNYDYLKSLAPHSRLIAVIKADAYGHGATEAARALPQADAFAVATVMEAITLREAGISHKVVVLGGALNAAEMGECASHGLDPVVHQFEHIDWLAALSGERSMDVWVKLNSGMGRLGFSASNFPRALEQLGRLPHLARVRLMTHLASADDRQSNKTQTQLQLIESMGLAHHEWSIANSAGHLAWPDSRKNWSRTGIALYGSDPMQQTEFSDRLKPVMTFSSNIRAINELKAGDSVGYAGLYTCPSARTIAVVAAGYADGYPRHLQNGYVVVGGRRAALVGRVSMDMITIDVSGMDVSVGDEVILWGRDPLAADIAARSETIAYELFCHAGCHGRKKYADVV